MTIYGNLGQIRLGSKSFGLDAAKVLAEVLPQLKSLRVANLADIIAGRPQAEALQVLTTICTALKKIPVAEINLSDNALGTKGVRACSELLSSLESLERLYLCNDGLSADACGEVADLLLFRSPTHLTTLHFFNNMQDDGGGIHIARVVELSPHLQDFRLSSTRCKNDGGVALGKALAKCSKLRRLDLGDNSFGAVGGVALAQVGRACHTALRCGPIVKKMACACLSLPQATVSVARVSKSCPRTCL